MARSGLSTAGPIEIRLPNRTQKTVVDVNGLVPLAALHSSAIGVADVTVGNAALKAVRATPAELVPAPGAGKINRFLGALLINNGGANAITESADNLVVRYENGTGPIASQTIETTGFLDQTEATTTNAEPKIDVIAARTAVENKALVLHNTGDGEFAGNAANDVTLRLIVWYRTITL